MFKTAEKQYSSISQHLRINCVYRQNPYQSRSVCFFWSIVLFCFACIVLRFTSAVVALHYFNELSTYILRDCQRSSWNSTCGSYQCSSAYLNEDTSHSMLAENRWNPQTQNTVRLLLISDIVALNSFHPRYWVVPSDLMRRPNQDHSAVGKKWSREERRNFNGQEVSAFSLLCNGTICRAKKLTSYWEE